MKALLLIILFAMTLAIKGRMYKMHTAALKHSVATHKYDHTAEAMRHSKKCHHWCPFK